MALRIIVGIYMLLAAGEIHAEPLWDSIARSLEQGKKHHEFCTKNPAHDRCKPLSGSELLVQCENRENPTALGRCHGALSAYSQDGTVALLEWRCVPRAVVDNTEQLRRLFIREAQRMPEVLHLPARQLLYYSVARAFSCSRQFDQPR